MLQFKFLSDKSWQFLNVFCFYINKETSVRDKAGSFEEGKNKSFIITLSLTKIFTNIF